MATSSELYPRMFSFLFIDKDAPDNITDVSIPVDGGTLQAIDYAQEHIAPRVKPGTTIHIHEWRNSVQGGTMIDTHA